MGPTDRPSALVINSLMAKSFYLFTLLIHWLAQCQAYSRYSINICIELFSSRLHSKERKETKQHHVLTQGWREETVRWGYPRPCRDSQLNPC